MVWVVAAVLFAVAGVMAFPSRRRVQRLGTAFAYEYGAWVDPDLVAAVDRAVLRERRLTAVWLALATSGLLVFSPVVEVNTALLVSAVLAMTVVAVVRLAHAGRELRGPSGRPSVARARVAGLLDFVSPIAVAGWIGSALAAFAVAGYAVHVLRAEGADADARAIGVLVGAVTLGVVLALGPVYAALVCRRPEPAMDAAHLYVQDAWRSRHLTSALPLLMPSFLMLVSAVSRLATEAGAWRDGFWFHGGMVFVFAAVSTPRDRFRRRLWPTLEPGRVLYRGEPVPGSVAR